jgi:hypothetical protein
MANRQRLRENLQRNAHEVRRKNEERERGRGQQKITLVVLQSQAIETLEKEKVQR